MMPTTSRVQDWANTPAYREFYLHQDEFKALEDTQLMREMIAFVKKENVVNIKIKSIKGQLAKGLKNKLVKKKTGGKKSPKLEEPNEDLETEEKSPEEKAYERITKDNIKETEVEYYIKLLRKKDQVKTMTNK